MAKSGHPTKIEALANQKRDNQIVMMNVKGFPLEYIAGVFNISKSRIVHILKKKKLMRQRSMALKRLEKKKSENKSTK